MIKQDFLDKDHEVSLDACVAIINAELQWCYSNPMPGVISIQFQAGFIKGLEQAKRLIIEVAKMEHK